MKNELTKTQMMDYLQSVKDLETLKIMQLNAKVQMLEKIRKCEAVINTRNKPKVEARRGVYKGESAEERGTCGFLILAVLIGAICGLVNAAGNSNHTFIVALFLDFGSVIGGTLVGAGIAAGIVLIIDAIVASNHQSQAEAQIEEQYRADLAEAERRNKEIDRSNYLLQQLRDEAWRKIDVYKMQIDRIEQDTLKIKKLLDDYYACNIIYPKFQRKLSYICRFVEYFESGMCDSLTGPNGGYILLDHDIKFGIVCEKLDNISDKLDMIRKEQRELYHAIERCQRSIDDLGNSIDNLTDRMEKHNDKIDDALQNIDYNINVGNEYNRISANYAMHRYIWDR